jgi:phospholipid/cholesterol/gamma-HCH transport system substrate-binding protein
MRTAVTGSAVNYKHIALGASVLIAVVLMLWMIPRIGSFGAREGKRYELTLDDTAGLTEDSPVRVAGVDVGKVERLEVEGGQAHVRLLLRPEVEIHADAIAAVRAKSLLGSKFLELQPGSPDAPLLAEGEAIGEQRSLFEIDEALNALEPILGGEDSIGAALEPVLARVEEGEGEVEDLIPNAEELGESITQARDSIRSTREAVEGQRESIHDGLATANEVLEGRRLDRGLTSLDRLTTTAANRLPGLFQDADRVLGRADSALAKVDEATRELTPERVRELDEALDEVVLATRDLRKNSEAFLGLGKDAGPVIANLSRIADRAARIDELTIRKFLQEEGFMTHIRIGRARDTKERLDELDE